MNNTHESTVGTLLALLTGKTEGLIEDLACQVLEGYSSFNDWCSHPECILAFGKVRHITGGFMIAGSAHYKNQHERIRVVIRNDNEVSVRRSAPVDESD